MKRMSLRTAIGFALVLVLMLTAAPVAASPQDKGIAGQARGAMLAQGGEDQGLLIVAPATVRTNVMPPDKLWIPVYVAVPMGADSVALKGIAVEVAGRVAEFDVSAVLEPQGMTTSSLVSALGEASVDPSIIAKGKYVFLEVDVSGLPLKEGDAVPVTIKARGSSKQQELESSVMSTYSVLSLPSIPGWYAGDGHIHTTWSDGGVDLDGRAVSAISHGLKWIVITDHSDGIGGRWSDYVEACDVSQFTRGIPVMPGFESTALDSDNGSDALGYTWLEISAGD